MNTKVSIFLATQFIFCFFNLTLLSKIFAQSVYLPYSFEQQSLVDRYALLKGDDSLFFSATRPFTRHSVAFFADSLMTTKSEADVFNRQYLRQDNWEWSSTLENPARKYGWWGRNFYRQKNAFYHYKDKDFEVQINPVVGVGAGVQTDTTFRPYFNSRGIEVRGKIANKIGFYSYFTDNQAFFADYVLDRITQYNAVPNEAYYKRAPGQNVTDFITARGYITFSIAAPIQVQIGQDRNFVGYGYRSLVLSDYSANYFFAKINTKVWKINYQNLYAQLNADVFNADGLYPRKFMVLHHLSARITPNFTFGVFESVIFNRADTTNPRYQGGFDIAYLNPIIFYRAVEQQLGSPDNAAIGADFRWNLWKRLSIYGQIYIDELIVAQLRNGLGWWGTKQGWQLGLKYVNVLNINNLDYQIEWNAVRPYTYSHNFKYNEYSHYNQPLAHPLGANFYELIQIVRYQPFPRWQMRCLMMYAITGIDDGKNRGGNIFLNNATHAQDFGNFIGQGIRQEILLVDAQLRFQPMHNFFVDMKALYRMQKTAQNEQLTTFAGIALHWNIAAREYHF